MTRDDVKQFLIGQKGKAKEQVLSSFMNLCITNGVHLDKLAKMLADLQSYPEWTWGE